MKNTGLAQSLRTPAGLRILNVSLQMWNALSTGQNGGMVNADKGTYLSIILHIPSAQLAITLLPVGAIRR